MGQRVVRFVFDRDVALPRLKKLLGRVGRGAAEHEDREDVVFDTPDLRLTRAGQSLTLSPADGLDTPPPAATDLLRAWIRSAPVVEVARLRTHRLRITITDLAGRSCGEIVDDDVMAWRPGRSAPKRLREVTVRLDESVDPAAAERLLARLRRRASGAPGRPIVARTLGRAALAPPDLAPDDPALSRRSGKRMTTADVVTAALVASVRTLLANDPVIRAGDDPEGVHRARVATRRLRADLRTFGPALDDAWSDSLRSELRWLGEQLGRVRDADVLRELLTAKAANVPDAHQPAMRALIERLETARRRDRDALVDAMGSTRYAVLLDRLVDAARAPRIRKRWRRRPAARVARDLTRRPWRGLRRAVRALPHDPSDAELHEVRKRAKRARYAFEAFAPVAGKPARRTARALTDLQTVLGEHQDAVVAAAWLADAARDPDVPEAAFVAGIVAGELAADRRRLRKRWPRVWKRVRKRQRHT